jgi:hypothetical protein
MMRFPKKQKPQADGVRVTRSAQGEKPCSGLRIDPMGHEKSPLQCLPAKVARCAGTKESEGVIISSRGNPRKRLRRAHVGAVAPRQRD